MSEFQKNFLAGMIGGAIAAVPTIFLYIRDMKRAYVSGYLANQYKQETLETREELREVWTDYHRTNCFKNDCICGFTQRYQELEAEE